MCHETLDQTIRDAATRVARADAIVVAAGAGMGVDSGLPDFRGPAGFWRAYPAYEALGLQFEEMASPEHFASDPALGWGFYGHRTNLYRATSPHEGFAILQRWVAAKPLGGFVFTSNVDDHFGRAGFDRDRIVEVHGSVEWWQCLDGCGLAIFPTSPEPVAVDPTTFRAGPPLPSCPACGGLARPNILMFGDGGWTATRTEAQFGRFADWLEAVVARRVLVVELGAGRAIPTVRRMSEQLVSELGATLIRINVREADVPPGQLGIAAPALATLRAIDLHLTGQPASSGDRLDQG